MLHNCDVENCEDTSAAMVEKVEIKERGWTHWVAGAANGARYKNSGQNENISIVDTWEILHFKVVGLKLRPGFENGCYEHMLLIKSEEVSQWIQLR